MEDIDNIPIDNKVVKQRNRQYFELTGLLFLIFYFSYNSSIQISPSVHTLIDVVSTIFAAITGVIALIRFYTRKDNVILFVGAGFIGTALLEGHHAFLTSTFFETLDVFKPATLVAWSGSSARIFLSILLFVSWFVWKKQAHFGVKVKINEKKVYAGITVVTILTIIVFAFLPIPRNYNMFATFRYEEFIAGFFFLLALIGYFKKGGWKQKYWEHYLILSLITAVGGQLVLLFFSSQFSDMLYIVAHLFKLLGYLFILAGFLTSVYVNYKKLESQTDQLNVEIDKRVKIDEMLKLTNKELEERNKELRALDQLKSDFVSTVSHELRTPLAISTEGISLIIDGLVGDINEKQKDLLITSKENLHRLNRIIDDLLDISKIESGKIDLFKNVIDMNCLVTEVVESFQNVVAVKDIKLTTSLPSEGNLLFVDKDKIIQVLTNLLNNAFKFTPEEGTIEVSLTHDENDVVCTVKDSGMGIDKGNVSKLFKKFQQIGRQEGPGIKGTGLGLAICKSLIELHGGVIGVKSELNKGAEFYFKLSKFEKTKLEFDNYFDEVLQSAQVTNCSVVFILGRLNNYDQIKACYGEEEVMKLMNKILSIIHEVISRSDDKIMMCDMQSIHAVFPDTNKAGGYTIINKIKESISKCIFGGKENSIKVDFKLALSVYPFEAQDRNDMIKISMDNIAQGKNILVVDDHPQIFRILESRLKDLDCHLRAAYDGEHAFEMIQEKRPDMIILDVMMPKMNGYEVLGRLKEDLNTASIPVILLTAKDPATVKKESAGFGLIPVVPKTGGFIHLIKMIKEVI